MSAFAIIVLAIATAGGAAIALDFTYDTPFGRNRSLLPAMIWALIWVGGYWVWVA